VPRHRNPTSVASGLAALGVQEDRVLALVVGERDLFEPELIALVEEDLPG
jgi:hypothetical protein